MPISTECSEQNHCNESTNPNAADINSTNNQEITLASRNADANVKSNCYMDVEEQDKTYLKNDLNLDLRKSKGNTILQNLLVYGFHGSYSILNKEDNLPIIETNKERVMNQKNKDYFIREEP